MSLCMLCMFYCYRYTRVCTQLVYTVSWALMGLRRGWEWAEREQTKRGMRERFASFCYSFSLFFDKWKQDTGKEGCSGFACFCYSLYSAFLKSLCTVSWGWGRGIQESEGWGVGRGVQRKKEEVDEVGRGLHTIVLFYSTRFGSYYRFVRLWGTHVRRSKVG